jgi:formate hydrogenlyase subunit 3/multisubunit Na+/H+ antiporter MnhD subunit
MSELLHRRVATDSTAFAFLLAAGAVSGVLGVLYTIAEHDLNRLLAYHSVENKEQVRTYSAS